ncbi:MAG TPA: hypothetical protein VK524_29625 [Polyangiaceae bacterium]|nr:hypothetical protein [Polyangiaceae bacterium]
MLVSRCNLETPGFLGFAWGVCVALLCTACGTAQQIDTVAKAKSADQDSAAMRHEPGQLRGASWRSVTLPRFALVVPLPEFAEWSIDDTSERWFVARHEGSRSELRVRGWSAARLGSDEQCESQARAWLPSIPEPAPDDAVEIRRLRSPSGYHGRVIAGVRLAQDGAELEGYALAFGAAVGRCYAAVFRTRATGARAEWLVGASLAVVAGGLLERVEATRVEDRAPHPRFPF